MREKILFPQHLQIVKNSYLQHKGTFICAFMTSLGIYVHPPSRFRTLCDLSKPYGFHFLSEESPSPLRQSSLHGGRFLLCMHTSVVCACACLVVKESNRSVIQQKENVTPLQSLTISVRFKADNYLDNPVNTDNKSLKVQRKFLSLFW